MEHPYYSVVVSGLHPQTWTLATVEGDAPTPQAPAVLVDGMQYTWSFEQARIPGHFDASTLTFSIAAHSKRDLPGLRLGQIIRVEVYIAPSASTGWQPVVRFVGRVTDLSYDLDPHWSNRPVIAHVSAADFLADLRNRFPDMASFVPQPFEDQQWEQFWFRMAGAMGARIYVPEEAMSDYTGTYPDDYNIVLAVPGRISEVSAYERAQQISNTYFPAGRYWTLMPHYAPARPEGYVGAESFDEWLDSIFGGDEDYPPDPDRYGPIDLTTPVQFLVAPVDRELHGSVYLPLVLAQIGGLWTLVEDIDPDAWDQIVMVDADLTESPAQAGETREHSATVASVEGFVSERDDSEPGRPVRYQEGVRDSTGPLAREYGPMARTISTLLVIRATDPDDIWTSEAEYRAQVETVRDKMLPDSSAMSEPIAFEPFTIDPRQLSSPDADRLLAALTPGLPNEGRRTTVPVYLHNLAGSLGLTGDRVTGFVSSGSLEIREGRISYEITLTPGLPDLTHTTSGIRYADFPAAARPVDIDPELTMADMKLARGDI